jgi:hypothetical protein
MKRRFARFGLSVGLWITALASSLYAIPVGNFSFETPAVPTSATPEPIPPLDWSGAAGAGGGAGAYSTSSPVFTNQQGNDLGFISVSDQPGTFGALFQDTVRIAEGTYDFTVAAGHEPGAVPVSTPLTMIFEATGGGIKTLLGANSFPVNTFNSNTLTDVTASLTIPPGASEIGHYLRLVLVNGDNGGTPETARAAYNFDNVRLNFTPPGGATTSAVVGHPSFEPTPFAPWVANGSEGGRAGIFRPAAPLFANQQGDQLGFVTMRADPTHAVLFQDATTIAAGTYTMTVGVAHDPAFPPTQMPLLVFFESIAPGYKANLGPVVTVTPVDVNATTLTDISVSVAVPAGSEDIGRSLRLVLVAVAGDPGADPNAADPRATYLLDNVRLDFIPEGGFAADFNDDDHVDAMDLAQWRGDFGIDAGSDADGDGDSDGADFLTWQRELGSTVPGGGAAAVPEPSAGCLATLLSAVLFGSRRRRS